MTPFNCDEFRDTAPDLALGLSTGDERGAAISHVVTCASCRRHLDALVQVADDLLLLAPSVEPEIGFESRVIARLAAGGAFSPAPPLPQSSAPPAPSPVPSQSSSPSAQASTQPSTTTPVPNREAATAGAARSADSVGPETDSTGTGAARRFGTVRRSGAGRHPGPTHPSRSRVAQRRVVVVAAALALAGLTGVAGLARGRDSGRAAALAYQATAANELAARTVVVWADKGRSWCQLVAFPGHGNLPASLVIHLEEPGDPPGSYQVLAEPTNGQPAVLVGTIVVADGHGMLTATVPAGTGPVDAIRVMDAGSVLRYRATFASV